MPMGFLLVVDSLKPFQRGRGVYMYTTQVNSAFRARWLASSVISQVLFFCFQVRSQKSILQNRKDFLKGFISI